MQVPTSRAETGCSELAEPVALPRELLPVSLEPCPVIEAYKKDVDRTLIRENLKLTPDERLAKMISVLAFIDQVRQSRREPR